MSSKKAEIVAHIRYSAHMTHEQADRWAKDVERRLKAIHSIPEDSDELMVLVKSCIEPPATVPSSLCTHLNVTPHPVGFPGKGLWCPDCRMDVVDAR